MRREIRHYLVVSACVAAMMAAGAVGVSPAAAPATIVFGLSSEPPNLDPALNTGTAAATVKLQLYRGLFRFGPTGVLEKDLVASYEHPTPVTYVFHLQPGLRFSDGSTLTAADVVFTFERIADPKIGAYLAKRLAIVQSVSAPDRQTVRVVLRAPDAAFLQLLALPYSAIVSKAFALDHGDNLKTVTLGEGPYVLTQWQRGVQLTVSRNPYYYRRGLPRTPTIRFVFYADDNTRVAALESGSVDLIEYVPWQAIAAIRANPQLDYQGTDGPFMYLVFNLTQPPFNDARVRRAVGHAIDREAILKTAFFGRGSAIYGLPIPKDSLAYDPALAHFYSYDRTKAKQLLTEAGLANGFTATLLSTAQYGMHKDTAQVVQQDLNEIGNHVTLSLPDWATRVSLGNQGRYQFAVSGTTGDYNDPDFLTGLFHSGPTYYNNAAGFSDTAIDRLLDLGRAAPERERKAVYNRIQEKALSESPYIFLTWREQGYAYRKGLDGFRNLPGFLTFDSGYTLEDAAITR